MSPDATSAPPSERGPAVLLHLGGEGALRGARLLAQATLRVEAEDELLHGQLPQRAHLRREQRAAQARGGALAQQRVRLGALPKRLLHHHLQQVRARALHRPRRGRSSLSIEFPAFSENAESRPARPTSAPGGRGTFNGIKDSTGTTTY